jgi:hypothetical protein
MVRQVLLQPGNLEVDALVQARHSDGHWYNAKIIKKTGRGASTAVVVHYVSFPSSHVQARAADAALGMVELWLQQRPVVPETRPITTGAAKW